MELLKNSVWEFKGSDLTEDGLYRVLDVMHDIETVVLFPLHKSSVTVRPIALFLQEFIEHVKNKIAIKSEYVLPDFILVNEEKIPKSHIVRRDRNYNLVKNIVEDQVFLFDYATKKRAPQLAEYAKIAELDRKFLARLLTQYWRYGQDIMSLLPAFSQSGGYGKDRKPSSVPLGSPKQPRTVAIEKSAKYIVTEADKTIFKKAIKKYYLKVDGFTLGKTFKTMLEDNFEEELKLADACRRVPYIPTIRQFDYWSKKLFTKDEINKKRTSENDFLRNNRGLLGSVIQDSFLPGTHFEIDATVADVHIVSELSSLHVLGRPTIYIIVDRASRMITGMHVSLYHASWRAARQALVNCFLPKSDYCQEFGININNSEWPCAHIPKELVCDNGEMIGLEPTKALSPMTKLSFTPPYRPDCKGVVEKRFDIINKDSIHELLGTTKGGNVVRGSRDPRKDATYTLKEVTSEIIKSVMEHNRSILEDLAFSSPLLIENDLSPTPINYWKIHILKHRHELQSASSDEVIARLLPHAEVSMTRHGIKFNGLYYSCTEIKERNLTSVARVSGQWRLEARIDENTTNSIYVRLDKGQDFTRCYLSPRSRMFKDKSMIESDFVQDWLVSKKEHNPVSIISINNHRHSKQLARNAKSRKENTEQITFAEKTKNVRQHRQEELEATTNILTKKIKSPSVDNIVELNPTETNPVLLPKGRKRRIKEDES